MTASVLRLFAVTDGRPCEEMCIRDRVYFIGEWWGRLPKAVALIVFILLAVTVIGYPIYALARWSDRYLARAREAKARGERGD